MAAINIQSLFADIIDTPEQREQKLLQQGMAQGQLLSSGLTGLTRAAAPLAQVAGQLGVQRQENLRRAVQPMIGIDPRTQSEKMAEKLGEIDTTTPQGLMQAAQAIQSVDPIRAAALRQSATELTRELSDRERTIRRQDEADARARAAEDRAVEAAGREVTRFEWQTEQGERNKILFDNSITEFNNRQSDRIRTEGERTASTAAANTLRSSLAAQILAADPDNPYLDALQLEDSFIPLNELRLIENQFKQGIKQDIGVYTVFDPESGKNVIMSFDKNTGEQLRTFGESARSSSNNERAVPNLDRRRKETIGKALDGEELFEKYKIYDMVTGDKRTGRNALIDMIHNYSERNNTTYVQSIASLRKKFEEINNAPKEQQQGLKEALKSLLSGGYLPSETISTEIQGVTVKLIED